MSSTGVTMNVVRTPATIMPGQHHTGRRADAAPRPPTRTSVGVRTHAPTHAAVTKNPMTKGEGGVEGHAAQTKPDAAPAAAMLHRLLYMSSRDAASGCRWCRALVYELNTRAFTTGVKASGALMPRKKLSGWDINAFTHCHDDANLPVCCEGREGGVGGGGEQGGEGECGGMTHLQLRYPFTRTPFVPGRGAATATCLPQRLHGVKGMSHHNNGGAGGAPCHQLRDGVAQGAFGRRSGKHCCCSWCC